MNHITSKAEAKRLGWTQEQIDDPANLQAVSHDCHVRITQEQRGYKPTQRQAQVIGADGWPA